MKKRSLKRFNLKKYVPTKDNEGNVIETYSDEELEDKALIWYNSSNLKTEQYGLVGEDVINIHYYGDLEILRHDLVIYNGNSYKVTSVKEFKRFKALEATKHEY